MNQAYKYKTKEASVDTGLTFFGARYYNPLIGRFITPDPLGMVDGPNKYLYCNNDPVNRIDSWGRDFWEKLKTVVEVYNYLNKLKLDFNAKIKGPGFEFNVEKHTCGTDRKIPSPWVTMKFEGGIVLELQLWTYTTKDKGGNGNKGNFSNGYVY